MRLALRNRTPSIASVVLLVSCRTATQNGLKKTHAQQPAKIVILPPVWVVKCLQQTYPYVPQKRPPPSTWHPQKRDTPTSVYGVEPVATMFFFFSFFWVGGSRHTYPYINQRPKSDPPGSRLLRDDGPAVAGGLHQHHGAARMHREPCVLMEFGEANLRLYGFPKVFIRFQGRKHEVFSGFRRNFP